MCAGHPAHMPDTVAAAGEGQPCFSASFLGANSGTLAVCPVGIGLLVLLYLLPAHHLSSESNGGWGTWERQGVLNLPNVYGKEQKNNENATVDIRLHASLGFNRCVRENRF